MKTVIALILFLFAVPSQADIIQDISLDVNLASRHSVPTYRYKGRIHEYNQKNYGLGVTASFSTFLPKNFEASVGWYENSYEHTSVYVSVTAKHEFRFGDFAVSPGIAFGYASGYEKTPIKAPRLQATVFPNIQISLHGVGIRIGYIPSALFVAEGMIPVSVYTLQGRYWF